VFKNGSYMKLLDVQPIPLLADIDNEIQFWFNKVASIEKQRDENL
jgi:hypothetical protein